MIKFPFSCLFCLSFALLGAISLANAELPTASELQTQIDETKKLAETDSTKATLQNLEATQNLLAQIAKQKSDNEALAKQIKSAKTALAQVNDNIAKLKADKPEDEAQLAKRTTTDLQQKLTKLQAQAEGVQQALTAVNANLVAQKTAPDKAQAALTANAARKLALNKTLTEPNTSDELKTKLEAELVLLDLQNSYNQTLLSGNEDLTELYSRQLEEKTLEQQNLQASITSLQTAINAQMVEDSKQKVEQAQAQQIDNRTTNPIISKELDFNTKLSEELLKQTTKASELSQDNLRIKNVLDNLQQTQRNIEEQISSLQGTLVLSRIINKQRQALPQDEIIKGLSKQIADLRVRIFDLSEMKDATADVEATIAKLESGEKMTFTASERSKLADILQDRNNILSEMIKSLNNQLNLSINVELNQQQVQTISDALQQKLQQQSFWVKSNSPMDLDWFSQFMTTAEYQFSDIKRHFDFSNWQDNLWSAGSFLFGLLLLSALISRKKEAIKQKLDKINKQIKNVTTDSQWNTPKAIFWTLMLCLPSTLKFLSVFVFLTYICLQNPQEAWGWGLKMAGYWLYFAFLVAMLRPHGIGYMHFNMPKKSNEIFRKILKNSAWVIALLLNTAIFSNLEMGIAYDVIGEVFTILVLMLMVFMVTPAFRQAISTYENVAEQNESPRKVLLTLVKGVLLLAPIALIVLIVMGYYYTALVLIEHLIATYFAVVTWIILRNLFYRTFALSSRRLAHRRLLEKRQKGNEQILNTEDDVALTLQDETMAVSEIKTQILKVTDFLLWVGLAAMLYVVWSDLITVAYYLNGVTLWQQATTTDKGTVMESITLLNLLVAFVILIVTYVLVRNLSGLLEALVFSNLKLSQGTPYTVTTLLTYLLIVLGATFAFASLGMSWTKLQWLFTALSVGLGFGMQEIFANFVSGIIILFERPVRIGDMVTIGSFNGTVSKIRIRATTLIDGDKKEVIVPNKAFITERIVNWALTSSMTRIVISVGVAYGSDLELVKKLLLQAANENPNVLKEPAPMAYFLTFGASTLDHELRVYVGEISNRTITIDALNRRINTLFAEHHIDIAFNQLDVFIKNNATNEEVKWSSETFPAK